MHLTDLDLGVLLDRERDPSGRRLLRAHLAACASCQRELAQFEATELLIGNSLQALDTPLPHLTMTDVHAAALVPGRFSHGRCADRPKLKGIRMAAAAVVLITTAAVAGAARGPLTALVTSVIRRIGSPPIPAGAPAAPLSRGVGILPDSLAEVDFRTDQEGGSLSLSVGTGPQLLIQASADGPRYAVRHDSVTVENSPTNHATYTIEIPQPPTTVTVRIGDRTVYRRVGAQIIVPLSVYRFAHPDDGHRRH